MPKRISMYVLAMVMVGVLLNHVSIAQKDNGLLLVVDGRELDVIGMAQEKWVKLTRDCQRVQQVEVHSKHFLDVQQLIQDYSPPSSKSAHIVNLLTTQDWSLAEVQFKELLPAFVLINYGNGKADIVPNAIWSGETHPWLAGPHIRQYLLAKVPQVPIQLLNCFDHP
jgi:hypothetical protein